MKKLFIIILSLAFFGLSTGALRAQTWNIGSSPAATEIVATLSDSTLTITGTGDMAFWNKNTPPPWRAVNTSIKTIVINSGVTSIGNYAFEGCSNLTAVTIPNSVKNIWMAAFSGCSALPLITIPDSVHMIIDYLFRDCSSLTSVTIPNSVTSIGSEAFYGCTALASTPIGNSVTFIGSAAFEGCSNLKSVTIGSAVTTIENNAFLLCNNLDKISCFATTPPTIYQSTFFFLPTSHAKIYVPCANQAVYQAAQYWKDFTYGNCNEIAIANLPQTAAISVYPNPVRDYLTIENDTYIIHAIQITDLTGKTVLATPAIINNTINVSSLSAGVYFLKIKTDKGEVVKKIIKN